MSARAFELPPLEAPADLPPIGGPALAAPQIDLQAEAEAARAAGHAAGFAAGMAEARDQLAPALLALQGAAADVAAERDRLAETLERAAIDLAMQIAEQALAGALDAQPERVVDVVRGGLRRLVERDRVTVLVHPDDLQLVRDATDGLLAELGGIGHCEVQAERRVPRGGAIVRTVEGEVDATLPTKLARVREVIAEELRGGTAGA
jgi:flagellar assembly protein FliH